MRRRTLLATMGAALAGVAGCQSGPSDGGPTDGPGISPTTVDPGTSTTTDRTVTDEPTTTELPSVTVVVGHGGALSPVASNSITVERGQVTYRVECRGEEVGPYTKSEPLPAAEYEELVSFVTTLDPESWKSFYECTDTCAVDDGRYFVELTVDGRTYETRLDTEVDPPDGIEQLQKRVGELGKRIDEPTPTCFRTETTATDRS